MTLDAHLDVTPTPDTVEFTFTVENAGVESVDLEFRSGQTADVAVYSEGSEVWRWSEGQMFTQAVRTETLAPGESAAREMTWTDPSPGEYTAEASLATSNVSLVERVTFAVP